MTPEPAGALAGTRVLDLTSVVMGPMATQILGDLGADVISVESAHPDTNRAMGPGPHRYLSGVSLNLLRSKRNIAVDLKTDDGREVLRRLAASCDVFVTNLRPGPLARLQMRYEDVVAIRPDVIYCQAQGFPSDSDRADDPAYDDIIQSATGVADVTRRAYGEPALVPSIFADKVAGMTVLYSILAALVHRVRTGEGQRIEIAMTEAVKAFMLVEHGSAAVPVPPLGPAGYQRVITPERRPQRTADGWINVLPYSKPQYDAIFTAGGRDDLIGDVRYADGRSRVANSDFLYQQVRDIMLQRTTAEWLEFCRVTQIPASPVVTLEEIVAEQPVATHPLVGDYHETRPGARMAATPMRARRPAPLPGQHNEEVLLELGYSSEEVEELAERGVLRSIGADGKLS